MVRTTGPLGDRDRMRNVCITLCNPTEAEKALWILFVANDPAGDIFRASHNIRYFIYQSEIGTGQDGTAQGMHHFQAYMELTRALSLRQIRNIVSTRAHYERRAGNGHQAAEYCRKEDTRDANSPSGHAGTPARSSLTGDIVDSIAAKATKAEIMLAHPLEYMKYGGNIDKMIEQNVEKRRWAMDIQIYYGQTGVGKSFMANDEENAYNASWPTGSRWWWPQYAGEHTVIMDEFRHQIKMDEMLRITDRYPMVIEYKGGNTQFRSKRLIITTNIEPRGWYPNVDDRTMLWRRLEEFCTIWKFDRNPLWNTPGHVCTIDEVLRYKVKWSTTNHQYERVIRPTRIINQTETSPGEVISIPSPGNSGFNDSLGFMEF